VKHDRPDIDGTQHSRQERKYISSSSVFNRSAKNQKSQPAGRTRRPHVHERRQTDVRRQTNRRQTASSLNAPLGRGMTTEQLFEFPHLHLWSIVCASSHRFVFA